MDIPFVREIAKDGFYVGQKKSVAVNVIIDHTPDDNSLILSLSQQLVEEKCYRLLCVDAGAVAVTVPHVAVFDPEHGLLATIDTATGKVLHFADSVEDVERILETVLTEGVVHAMRTLP